jgi:transporter family protein
MLERWFILALFAITLFALGSFFGKIASTSDIPFRVYFFEGMGTITVLCTVIFLKRNEVFTGFALNVPALLMGLSWGIGTVLFIMVLKDAKLSVTVPLTGLYPALTVMLAFVFLGERLGVREIAGVSLAIIAAVLLAR